jgi:regulator of sigma E protease
MDMIVLRDDREVHLTADVNRKGQLNVHIGQAWDLPLIADPMLRLRGAPDPDGNATAVDSPVAGLRLAGRTRLDAVNDTPVTDWASFNAALRRNTLSAFKSGEPASVTLAVTHPTPGREQETVILELATDEVVALHELPRVAELPLSLFEPLYMTMTADGNPLRAVTMGFQETKKVIVMTYLTLDRLIRGSVGVEQIRGPVGIVHIGAKVADRGVTYLLFFLGIISVNLAVINFLPIPIVDGGLFLFLVYEKFKGRPPPMAFQNAATIAGVAMIATALLVVTWNDLMRLIG